MLLSEPPAVAGGPSLHGEPGPPATAGGSDRSGVSIECQPTSHRTSGELYLAALMTKLISFSLLVLLFCFSTCPAQLPVASAAKQEPNSTSTTLKLAGLRERVTVRRDERGIPYIEAANDDDLYFAQGYITASDRLWQMDLLRRNVRGELAEVLGPAVLSQDQLHRTLGFGRIVDATASQMAPQMRGVLEAYAKGVNAFIATRNNQNLPPEFLILQ